MSNFDNAIKDVAYILDSLMALRNIHQTGSCNECGAVKTCEYAPKPGQMVRYNCPFYVGKPAGTEDRSKIDGGTVVDFVEYLNRNLLKYVEVLTPNQELQEATREIAKQFIEEYGE
jgi:hypothetical protein